MFFISVCIPVTPSTLLPVKGVVHHFSRPLAPIQLKKRPAVQAEENVGGLQ